MGPTFVGRERASLTQGACGRGWLGCPLPHGDSTVPSLPPCLVHGRALFRPAFGHAASVLDRAKPMHVRRLQRSALNSTHEPTAPVSRSRIPTSRTTL